MGGRQGKRHFSQHALDENGKLLSGLCEVKPFLYRLPEVVEAREAGEEIWIVEGEKDVESLRSLGVVATCNPGGAGQGKWHPEYAEKLHDAKVIIVPDRDDIGRKHAREIYDSLIGFADSVQVLEARTGKDVTDHVKAGHALTEMVPVKPSSLPHFASHPAKTSAAHSRKDGNVTSMALWAVLDALAPLGQPKPPSQPGGDWQVCCPCPDHGDTDPSATVNVGNSVPVVLPVSQHNAPKMSSLTLS